MQLINQLDFVDKEILRLLKSDSRQSYVEIAKELKVSCDNDKKFAGILGGAGVS